MSGRVLLRDALHRWLYEITGQNAHLVMFRTAAMESAGWIRRLKVKRNPRRPDAFEILNEEAILAWAAEKRLGGGE